MSNDIERRKQQALRRLGTDTPRCGACGESRWQALEAHHIAGQAHDAKTTAVICRNDHRVLSDAQFDHPSKQDCSNSQLEAIGHFLLGLADMLKIAVEKLVEFGLYLIELAKEPPPASSEGRGNA